MNVSKASIFAAAVLAATSAMAQEVEVVPRSVTVSQSVTFISHVAGNRLVFEVRDSDLANSPSWDGPENEAPPMSLAEAVRIARQEVPRYVTTPERWLLHGIGVQSLGRDGKWFYLVSWRPPGNHVGDDLSVVVLMSGEAVQGQIANEADR